jgi:hypothetical protein
MYTHFQRITGIDPIEARLNGVTDVTLPNGQQYTIGAEECFWYGGGGHGAQWSIEDLRPDEPKGDVIFLAMAEMEE